jgi:hypothetical protein
MFELEGEDSSPGEKAVWERELTGISFTEPGVSFERLRNLVGTEAVDCGDIDASMDRQRVKIVGHVASVRKGFTREGAPFVSALLKDLSGEIEVTAWRETFQSTEALWQVNMPLVIDGRVRVRDDRLSLVCNEVRTVRLEPEEESTESEEELTITLPGQVSLADTRDPEGLYADGAPSESSEGEPKETVDSTVVENPNSSTSNGVSSPPTIEKTVRTNAGSNGATSAEGSGESINSGPTTNDGSWKGPMVVTVQETADVDEDTSLLNRVFEVLQRHPGEVPVRLLVRQVQGHQTLDLPVGASFGPELASELAGVLGEGALFREGRSY